MHRRPLQPSRHAHPIAAAAAVAASIAIIGGSGYALAVNELIWVLVIAATAAAITAWTEARHIAATKRQIAALAPAPRPRHPVDDNPTFLHGS